MFGMGKPEGLLFVVCFFSFYTVGGEECILFIRSTDGKNEKIIIYRLKFRIIRVPKRRRKKKKFMLKKKGNTSIVV